MANTDLYKLMCYRASELQQKWRPKIGDEFINVATYCCDVNLDCTKQHPCEECLLQSNTFILANHHCHKVFLFNPVLCNRTGGNLLDDTSASIFVPNRADSLTFSLRLKAHITHQEETIWIPSLTQLQQMVMDSDVYYYLKDNEHTRIKMMMTVFLGFIDAPSFESVDSMEEAWIKYLMATLYQKNWVDNHWVTLENITN